MAINKDSIPFTVSRTEPFPSASFRKEVRIILIGKTGSGKSGTGNTILGENKFESKASASLVTRTSHQYSSKRFGQPLSVIDVPGYGNTTLSKEELKTELAKAVGLSHTGVHAILVLIEVGRFTEDDIEQFLEGFGKDLMSFAIAIITKIDYLKRQKKELDEYLKTAPKPLKTFLTEINHRFLGVDNLSDAAEKDDFVKKLLSKIDSLVEENRGRCYTHQMFLEAEKQLKRREEEARRRHEEKRKRAKDELRRKVEQQNPEQEEKDRQMKALQMGMEEFESLSQRRNYFSTTFY